jgi:hypothetical protein
MGNHPTFFMKIIDDFYEDPWEVRKFALSCKFTKPFTGSWNGYHSKRAHPQSKNVFIKLAGYVDEMKTPNWEEIESSQKFWGRASAGVFALLLKDQQDTPHAHKRTGRWAGVCYLTPNEGIPAQSGLYFYQHKSSRNYSCNSASEENLINYRKDSSDINMWTVVDFIEMKFNRLVLFDGQYFHSASPGFGNSKMTGRLTQLFAIDFLEDIKDQKS